MPSLNNALCAMFLCALAGCVHLPQVPPMKGTVSSPSLEGKGPASATLPFLLDDNRTFVELEFVRPDGTTRRALAHINQGQAPVILSDGLYKELEIEQERPLKLRFGGMVIAVKPEGVQTVAEALNLWIGFGKPQKYGDGDYHARRFAPLKVEAVLPAGVLQNFQVVMDYGARTLTLAAPGTLKPEGVSVPLDRNEETGLVSLAARAGETPLRLVIDDGGSYTVLRSRAIDALRDAHPDWQRGEGAVGEANTSLDATPVDIDAPMLRLPQIEAGALKLDQTGVVGSGMGVTLVWLLGDFFWDMYSDKAGGEVDGWIGGNVLKAYRLTIDYPNNTSWWLKQADSDTHDLDQVGITLGRVDGKYVVAGISEKDGKPTVGGVETGDALVEIDGTAAQGMTRGQVLAALHGTPGERHHLVLVRGGKRVAVDAAVTGF